ncbi:uncharacterized protein LODBEIA_P14040 [Lodderomyces beijingensis]|uniref:ATP synthase subunit g, mitochondrial n=1 Tax=Lodderomyces beijingensis TaxID=1775926 RepID=A0ABP0ZG81_9ASCO
MEIFQRRKSHLGFLFIFTTTASTNLLDGEEIEIMSAIVSKAAQLADSIISKSNELVSKSVYWSKVSWETTKIVAQKEGLNPPTAKQFETAYKNAWKYLTDAKDQQKLLQEAKSFKLDTKSAVQLGVYGIQIAGFFTVGEVIGRRRIFGYPALDTHHH